MKKLRPKAKWLRTRWRLPRKNQVGDSMGCSNMDGNPYFKFNVLGSHIREALDPVRAPSKVRTLNDMTPEEREEMLRLYGR